jgi:hypothetical protein
MPCPFTSNVIQPTIIKSTDPLDQPNEIEVGRSKAFGATMEFGERRDQVKRAKEVRE